MLPAFAVLVPLTGYFAAKRLPNTKYKIAIAVALILLVVVSYASVWHSRPMEFSEAWTNSRSRIAIETQLASLLKDLPPNSTFLMYLGDHVGTFQNAGIPLSRTINEGNHRPWKQPADPEGLWERALANPAQYVDYAIAFDGDAVERQIQKQDLSSLIVLQVPGQPTARIYSAHRNRQTYILTGSIGKITADRMIKSSDSSSYLLCRAWNFSAINLVRSFIPIWVT
jgi:hypothetical protein